MAGRLQGKRALVTGAAGALGRVIAETLAAEGADVAGLDLNGAGLEETAGLVRAHGVRALMTLQESGLPDPGPEPEYQITPDPVWTTRPASDTQ